MTVRRIVELYLRDNGYACDPPEGEDGEPGSWIGATKAVTA